MPRNVLVSLLLFMLLLGGLATFNPGWLTLAIPLAVYLLAGFAFTPEDLNLSVERTISPSRAAPGQEVHVQLCITNRGNSSPVLQITDHLPQAWKIVDGSTSRLFSLKKGETLKWEYTFTGRRGYHEFEGLQVNYGDTMGLIAYQALVKAGGEVLILPLSPRVKRIAIRTRATRVYSGMIPARTGGSGVDFFGVREYQPGDPMHAVNWRVSARHPQAMFANEYEQERVADVGIILDARMQATRLGETLSILDESIIAAGALADAFLSTGNRVGLLVYGQFINWTLPGYGKQQRERILKALACAVPGESQAFTGIYIPRNLFPVHSQIVFVSPLIPEDVEPLVRLRAKGYSLIVVSPDPVRFEQSMLPPGENVNQAVRILTLRRKLILQKLRHAGVQIVDWDVSHPFEQVVESVLSRPPAFLRAIGAGH